MDGLNQKIKYVDLIFFNHNLVLHILVASAVMPAVMSLLNTRPFRLAMFVGAGLVVGGIVYGIWQHRRARGVVRDISRTDLQADRRWKLKDQLKTLVGLILLFIYRYLVSL